MMRGAGSWLGRWLGVVELRDYRLVGHTPDGRPVYEHRDPAWSGWILADGTPWTGEVVPVQVVSGL